MKNIRIILVDDHSIMRIGIASLLSREKDMEVVGEAENGEEPLSPEACRPHSRPRRRPS